MNAHNGDDTVNFIRSVQSAWVSGAELDAELILLANALWKELGLQNVRLELNSLGQPTNARHRASLIGYRSTIQMLWMRRARRRLHSNPLRILDTKNPASSRCQAAPRLIDFLGEASSAISMQ